MKLFDISEEKVRFCVYLIAIPVAIISGISAVIFAAMLNQELGILSFKIFAGIMGFIAIYTIQTYNVVQWKQKDDE